MKLPAAMKQTSCGATMDTIQRSSCGKLLQGLQIPNSLGMPEQIGN
jgi:hypothetical protein